MSTATTKTIILSAPLPTFLDFDSERNTGFRLTTDEMDGFDVDLVEVKSVVSDGFQEHFTLLFCSEREVSQQGIFHLEHDKLGAMDLFLVPIRRDEKGTYLEAVFNLIKS